MVNEGVGICKMSSSNEYSYEFCVKTQTGGKLLKLKYHFFTQWNRIIIIYFFKEWTNAISIHIKVLSMNKKKNIA